MSEIDSVLVRARFTLPDALDFAAEIVTNAVNKLNGEIND